MHLLYIIFGVSYNQVKKHENRSGGNNMETLKIENGKIYRTSILSEKTDVFEISDKIPKNYFVWNIGKNMGTDKYIPICEDLHPEDKDDYSINPATLKAVKVTPEECEKLRNSASWGIGNLIQAQKALKSKRRGYNADQKRKHAEITIDIFKRLCE